MHAPTAPQRFAIRSLRAAPAAVVLPAPAALAAVFLEPAADDLDLVKEVEAESLYLSTDEVRASLKRRTLRSTDLVFERGAWCTLADSAWLGELAAPWARRERRRRGLLALAAFVFGLTMMALKVRYPLCSHGW